MATKLFEDLISPSTITKLSDINFIKGLLLKYNKTSIFEPFFQKKADDLTQNKYSDNEQILLTSYVICLYSVNSTWVDLDCSLDKIQKEIFNSLISYIGLNKSEYSIRFLLENDDVNNCAILYLDSQHSSLHKSYHALSKLLNDMDDSCLNGELDEKDIKIRADYSIKRIDFIQQIETIKKLLEEKYTQTDEVLKRQDKPKFSTSNKLDTLTVPINRSI